MYLSGLDDDLPIYEAPAPEPRAKKHYPEAPSLTFRGNLVYVSVRTWREHEIDRSRIERVQA